MPLFEDHTGENIVESINDILGNWKLSTEKLVLTTTDNGSNFVAGFHSHGLLRLSCFGHCLDLAISKCLAMQTVERAIRRCSALVASFSRSWKKQRDLKEKQSQLNLPEHKLLGAVTTRWGSTYDMVQRILEQQQAISAVLLEDRKSWCLMLNDRDVTVLEEFVKVVKPLSVLTDALSGEKEVTCSAIRPLLHHVVEICKEEDEDMPLSVEMKSVISTNLSSRYESAVISLIVDKCSFLDPRFKENYVADTDLTKSNLLTEMLEQHQDDCSTSLTNPPQQQDSLEPEPPAKKAKGLTAILKRLPNPKSNVPNQQPLSLRARMEKEIINYLEQPCIETDCNPLLWWKNNCIYFPLLAVLARKYLCIPATSVPSERIFSKGGIIVNLLRNRLKPQHVNNLMFLSKNME